MENSLYNMRPHLVSEWSEKNHPITPKDISYGSNEKVWWTGKCGHEWQASVKARSQGEKCPICSGARVIAGINDLATKYPNIAAEWSPKNLPLEPNMLSPGSHKKYIWVDKLGHEWIASVKSRVQGSGCPSCPVLMIWQLVFQILLPNGRIGITRFFRIKLQHLRMKRLGGSVKLVETSGKR